MLSKLFRSRARFDDADPQARRDVVSGLSDEDVEQHPLQFARPARRTG